MYRPQIILARTICGSRPLKLPQSNATLNALPLLDSIHRLLCTVLGKSIRRRTVASVVAASHCAELQR